MYKAILITVLFTLVTAREDIGARYVVRMLEDCEKSDGVFLCLKKKAVLLFDRAARLEAIPLFDGLEVVKTTNEEIVPISENEIEASLPRSLEAKDNALTTMLLDRIARFASSRAIQFTFPKMTGEDLSKGVEEGRGKMKKMMSMMMMGGAMKMMSMIPVGMAALFGLAGKALITSKIALLLAGILLLKKLVAQKNGDDGGHESHGWASSGGGGGGGGWNRRTYSDAADMAYSGYKRN